MSIAQVTRAAVIAAIEEYDRLGADEFLAEHGFGAARRYLLEYAGRTYDSKAILGVAHGIATDRQLTAADFSGGETTVARALRRLGFTVLVETHPPGEAAPSRARLARHFGHIPGVPVGHTFARRADASAAGVHRPTQAGISGTAREGADSVVVSGGYADDQDEGDVIIYTGHGGRDAATGRQVADQRIEDSGNAGLITSQLEGLPVRVVRAPVKSSPHAPSSGYRYDGLFRVDSHWTTKGQDGFLIVQYRLEQLPDPHTLALSALDDTLDAGGAALSPVGHRTAVVQRQIRSSVVAQRVKTLHDHQCQVCGSRIEVEGGWYAEAAHIRPLGQPHAGPDHLSNVLCLCPNDHVRLDNGGIIILEDLTITSCATGQTIGKLRTVTGHDVDPNQLAYHITLWQPRVPTIPEP